MQAFSETRSDMPGYTPDDDRSSVLDASAHSVRFLVRHKRDASTVREAILEAGLFPDEMRIVSELERGNVPGIIVVDMSEPQALEGILALSGRCGVIAISRDAAHEVEATRGGAVLVLSSPVSAEVLTLHLRRLQRQYESDRERSDHAERQSVIARADSVRYVAQSASRAVREPLTVARLNLELLGEKLHRYRTGDPPDWVGIETVLQECHDALSSVSEAISDLNELARFEGGGLEPVALEDPVRKAVAAVANPKQVPIEISIASRQVALARADILQRVVSTLLSNALHAVRGTTVPKVRVRVYGVAGECRISVRDNGSPISAEARVSIFEPFFSQQSGSQVLIGLALARDLVARMGGALTMAPGTHGSCFRVRLRPA